MNLNSKNQRYDKTLAKLTAKGYETGNIEAVVNESIKNINSDKNSFVICGEPQSGKTEMMIALTAKLLDEGHKIIVILLNDSIQLLEQNLERFERSGLSPTPKSCKEIIASVYDIGDKEWVIFCKKNAHDLEKLNKKIHRYEKKVIIDDEADYATPNSKINKKGISKINKLTTKLRGDDGIYIGITATPARLDLNRTHDNDNELWIYFHPHDKYRGQKNFFPLSKKVEYILSLLPDEDDSKEYLRQALFSFIVNVAHLNNINKDEEEKNYSLLVHTSGKKADHSTDYDNIVKYFGVLSDNSNKDYERYMKEIRDIAAKRYPKYVKSLLAYILNNIRRNIIVVMNSDAAKKTTDNNRKATEPAVPFTVVIGGNIVSRGVTFDNLISMFFTRNAKLKIQQDTYIQRARMFGNRGEYLKYFELTIPEKLYLDWHKCFVFHQLSLESVISEHNPPIWLENNRIAAVATSSINRTRVSMGDGEMSFTLFDYSRFKNHINNILNNTNIKNIQKIKEIYELLEKDKLLDLLIKYIGQNAPDGDESFAIHKPKDISGFSKNTTDVKNIVRKRKFIGKWDLEKNEYPKAIHHIFILYNASGKARLIYKLDSDDDKGIRYLRTIKN